MSRAPLLEFGLILGQPWPTLTLGRQCVLVDPRSMHTNTCTIHKQLDASWMRLIDDPRTQMHPDTHANDLSKDHCLRCELRGPEPKALRVSPAFTSHLRTPSVQVDNAKIQVSKRTPFSTLVKLTHTQPRPRMRVEAERGLPKAPLFSGIRKPLNYVGNFGFLGEAFLEALFPQVRIHYWVHTGSHSQRYNLLVMGHEHRIHRW